MDMDSMLLDQTLREDEKYLNRRKSLVCCICCVYADPENDTCKKDGHTLHTKDSCFEGEVKRRLS